MSNAKAPRPPELVTEVDLSSAGLTKIASGKVREIFEVDADTLLFVTTDRISAFDVVMGNGVPFKGAILTHLSAYWFELITAHLPHLRHHFLNTAVPPSIPAEVAAGVQWRCMQVRRLPILPVESIVRGHILGSAWAEYEKSGTINGMRMPQGLWEGARLEKPLWTPSTKAAPGEHDRNISPDEARELLGAEVAAKVEAASLEVYEMARAHAIGRGIIIADTKLEFGLDPATNEVVLVDEVLTPDSSRFWPAESFDAHVVPHSYDKQFLREWLKREDLQGKEGVVVPEDVLRATTWRYRKAYEKLTARDWLFT